MTLNDYNTVCNKLNKEITNAYSTSFSIGISMFSKKYRTAIYSIYSYVRIADEIVDTFHGFDKKQIFDKYRNDTFDAINQKISTNPVLNSFQFTVNKYNIEHKLIYAFLESMEKDLYNNSYDTIEYSDYIYGSAEVVGLMCLQVFCDGDKSKYDSLEYSAKMLGSAFQKVNFLRDIKSDIEERNRIYLPNISEYSKIDNESKKKLEEEVEIEFSEALKGILKLPDGVKTGVYTAYLYYLILFKQIKKADIKSLLTKRIRVSNFKKLILFIKSLYQIKILRIN